MSKEEKIIIGNSDYTREEMESGAKGALGDVFEFLRIIRAVEKEGYEVKFETSFLRKIFGTGKYRVVGYKTQK